MDIVDEIKTLTQDITSLRNAYRENEDEGHRAAVLRMCAAKCEHVAYVFREMADAIERGLQKVL